MTLIVPFSSRRNGLPSRRDFDRFVENLWLSQDLPSEQADFLQLDVDVSETGTELTVHAELPGVDEKNLSVEFNNGTLTIKGEKKIERAQEGRDFHIAERRSGSFSRSIKPPFEVNPDEISACFSDGVLKIVLPKSAQTRENVKKIEVRKG